MSPELALSTNLTAGGQSITGSNATMDFELIATADPYFTNIPTGGTNEAYLRQDLRVFNARPAFPGGPTFSQDNVAGAYGYIKALLAYLNGQTDFTNPAGTDPFSLLPDQAGEGQTDTSAAPLALSHVFPPTFVNNYNFAIARVRLRSPSAHQEQRPTCGCSSVSSRARVPTATSIRTEPTCRPRTRPANRDSVTRSRGHHHPFFATSNAGSETDYQPGGPNVPALTIPSGQDDLWWYCGCFLNFYDPANVVDGQQVQAYLVGTHHCVVAEIAYDDAPIPTGVSPPSWDQLAQRNLQFTLVDNPGPAATHRAPQTFDMRPSKSIGTPAGACLPADELRWTGAMSPRDRQPRYTGPGCRRAK